MKHPLIKLPEDNATQLWRYMSMDKYQSLLETSSLYFCRSDLFEDPFEGSYSFINNEDKFDELYSPPGAPPGCSRLARERMRQMIKYIRFVSYINCWHMSEYESAAMWKLYGESVCIRTSLEKLKSEVHSFNEKIEISVVSYFDYRNDFIPEFNTITPFVCKRKSFEYEKELRAIWQHPEGHNMPQDPSNQKGYLVKIDPSNLIQKIYVHPNCSDDFRDEVTQLTNAHGLSASLVVRSDMETAPFW